MSLRALRVKLSQNVRSSSGIQMVRAVARISWLGVLSSSPSSTRRSSIAVLRGSSGWSWAWGAETFDFFIARVVPLPSIVVQAARQAQPLMSTVCCFTSAKMERAPPVGWLLTQAFPSAVVVVARQDCPTLWAICCYASAKDGVLGSMVYFPAFSFPSLPTALPPWLVGDFFLHTFSSCCLAQEQVASILVAQPHINFSS